MTKQTIPTYRRPKTLIIGVQAPYNRTLSIQAYYDEFRHLVTTNGIQYDAELYIKLRSTDPAHFFTKGKLQQIIDTCRAHDIEEVIISERLSGKQERNLSDLLEARVFDRTQLILEIFEQGASSAAGKLQVELAMLKHRKSRLAGRGKHMSRQSGKIGTRGPGETQKEQELRHINQHITRIQRRLRNLEKTQATQRKRRLESPLANMSLVGYTNAGKSSILNTLTRSEQTAENQLFATLDTTTRELYLDDNHKALLSDTVGFIQQLPHTLIEAFKSTLSELSYSDLLLHVVDISHPEWRTHINVVHNTLDELEIDQPILYVFNKVDRLEHPRLAEHLVEEYEPHVLVSTHTEGGLDDMRSFLRNWLDNEYGRSTSESYES